MRHHASAPHQPALRNVLQASAQRRLRQKKTSGAGMAAMLLYVVLGLQPSHAVVPYRAPEDVGPSPTAREHLPACRRAALDAMTGVAGITGASRIESESFVQRAEAEYFRFVLRNGNREVLIICDGHAGTIRRQIDIWGDL